MFAVPGQTGGMTSKPERSDEYNRRVNEWLERTLANAPPLTPEQRNRLAILLSPAREATQQERRDSEAH